jgi:hypothetical protein
METAIQFPLSIISGRFIFLFLSVLKDVRVSAGICHISINFFVNFVCHLCKLQLYKERIIISSNPFLY